MTSDLAIPPLLRGNKYGSTFSEHSANSVCLSDVYSLRYLFDPHQLSMSINTSDWMFCPSSLVILLVVSQGVKTMNEHRCLLIVC